MHSNGSEPTSRRPAPLRETRTLLPSRVAAAEMDKR